MDAKSQEALEKLSQATVSTPSSEPEPKPSRDDKLNIVTDVFLSYDANRHPDCKIALARVSHWVFDTLSSSGAYDKIGVHTGRALVLWSSDKKGTGFGNGKTLLARLAADALRKFLRFTTVEFTGDDKFISGIRDSFSLDGPHAIFKELRKMDAVIIDDFGTAYVKTDSLSWYQEQYYKLLNFAYDARQPLLLTTNLTPDEVADRLGGKNFSRLEGLVGGKGGWVNMSNIPDQRVRK